MTRGIGSKFKVRGTDSGKAPEKKFGPPCFSAAPPPVWGHSARRGGHRFAKDIRKSITSMIVLRDVSYTPVEQFRVQYVQMNS